jgi:hypothetical protein
MDELIKSVLLQIESVLRNSYEQPKQMEQNLELLEKIEDMLPFKYELPLLRNSIHENIIRNFMDCRISEKDVYTWFKQNIEQLLPDYKIAIRGNDLKHIPDFWLSKNGLFVPVEIKFNEFALRHLKQLQRYIDFYNCNEGIAVAKTLNCILPDNIKFIMHQAY